MRTIKVFSIQRKLPVVFFIFTLYCNYNSFSNCNQLYSTPPWILDPEFLDLYLSIVELNNHDGWASCPSGDFTDPESYPVNILGLYPNYEGGNIRHGIATRGRTLYDIYEQHICSKELVLLNLESNETCPRGQFSRASYRVTWEESQRCPLYVRPFIEDSRTEYDPLNGCWRWRFNTQAQTPFELYPFMRRNQVDFRLPSWESYPEFHQGRYWEEISPELRDTLPNIKNYALPSIVIDYKVYVHGTFCNDYNAENSFCDTEEIDEGERTPCIFCFNFRDDCNCYEKDWRCSFCGSYSPCACFESKEQIDTSLKIVLKTTFILWVSFFNWLSSF